MKRLSIALVALADQLKEAAPKTYNIKLMNRHHIDKPKESWQSQGKRKKRAIK